jgi:hypothetical protein
VRVFESGHEVPLYQPVISQDVWQRAIFGKDIATGTEDTTADTGTTGDGTYISIPKSGMDPGPFLSWDGTKTVTGKPPQATSESTKKGAGLSNEGVTSRGANFQPNIMLGIGLVFGITLRLI